MMPSNIKDKAVEYGSRFGLPIATALGIVFLLMLILVNIPPIPLPFTDNKLYLINQVFAEQFKFYGYLILYFVLVFLVAKVLNMVFNLVTSKYKMFYKKFQRLVESLI